MLTLMTYNVYLGADLTPLLLAPTQTACDAATSQVFERLRTTDFRVRANLLAQEITAVRPDVIALQEAVLWEMPAALSRTNGDDGRRDYLQLLLNALRGMGHEYWPVSVGVGPDINSVAPFPGLRFTNRNVILARSNFCTGENDIRLPLHGTFINNVEVTNPVLGAVKIARSWASIDIYMRGSGFRFVSVHLEDSQPTVRQAQTAELIRRLSFTTMPIVLVGDFNEDANTEGAPAYQMLLESGFKDAWDAADGTGGATCCQADDLRNESSSLANRIDFVLTRGKASITAPFLVGVDPARRRTNGLWASDHAGIVATLQSLG